MFATFDIGTKLLGRLASFVCMKTFNGFFMLLSPDDSKERVF